MFDENNAGSMTKTAYYAATQSDDQYACQTAEDCLSFLKDSTHFASLQEKLKSLMKVKLNCDESKIPEMLTKLLVSLEKNPTPDRETRERNFQKTVNKWFNGKTSTIGDLEQAVKICFVLKLSYEESCDFLTKACGFPQLNPRSAQEAIYMYCLMNGKDYDTCESIRDKYDTAICECSYDDNRIIEEKYTGNTTIQFVEALNESNNWKDEDDFLNIFLIPNKDRFLGYSRTTRSTYYKLKKDLLIKVIDREVKEETRHVSEGADDCQDDKATRKILSLIKYNDFLKSSLGPNYIIDSTSPIKYWNDVKKAITGSDLNNEEQCQLLHEITPIDKMAREIFVDFPYDYMTNKHRPYKESSLSTGALKSFPQKAYFNKFEQGEELSSTTIRKMLVFLLFMNHLYDFSNLNEEGQRTFFSAFFEQMDSMLYDCRLAPIYLANQFDWLILRCIHEVDNYLWKDGCDPEDFFGKIISLSFEDESTC